MLENNTLFLVVAGVIAAALFVLIARNLIRMDREDRGSYSAAAVPKSGSSQLDDRIRAALQSLNSGDPDERGQAVKLLGERRYWPAVPNLIFILRSPMDGDPDSGVYQAQVGLRVLAARALGRIGDRAAVPALLEALNDDDPYLRGAAAEALGQVGDPAAVSPLIDHLGDTAGMVRPGTIDLLPQGRLPNSVSLMAADALKKIGTPEALSAVQQYEREQAASRPLEPNEPPAPVPVVPPALVPGGGASPDDTLREIPDEFLAPREETVEAPEPAVPSVTTAQFSTYYPREVRPAEWNPLAAYVFRGGAEAAVNNDAQQQLGDRLPQFRRVGEEARQPIEEGALITATPQLDGFRINPPSISLAFFEDWHRFDFKIQAHTAPLNQAVNGVLTFTVEGVIVADIPLAIFVTDNPGDNPGGVASMTVRPYQSVFASYSRKDKQIVERVERAYRALGMETLRDLNSLRSGEGWRDGLKSLIDRADIFQLFWSVNSASSEHVRWEWEYALTLSSRPNFIRPVYWQSPLPSVPDPLRELHFSYQPELDD